MLRIDKLTKRYAYILEIYHQFVSEPIFFFKFRFFRSAGNVFQQIKKVSPKVNFDHVMVNIYVQ